MREKQLNTHNNTQIKTHVGTFQQKYHRVPYSGKITGGQKGSYGISLKEFVKANL
jgi:hypothetical protein